MSARVDVIRGAAAVVALAALAAVITEVLYRLSPTYGVAAVAAAAIVPIIFWRPSLGIYASLLAIALDANSASVAGSSVTPAKALLLVTAASVLPRLLLNSAAVRVHRVHVWFLGLVGVSCLGLTFAPDKHAVLVTTAQAFAYLLISIYVARMDRPALVRVLVVLAVSGGLVGVSAIIGSGAQTNPLLVTSTVSGNAGRAQLGQINPNIIAFYLLLALGPAISLAVGAEDRWQRIASAISIPLIAAGIILTQSRAAIVGGVLILLVLLGSSQYRRVALPLALVLVLVVAVNFNAVMSIPQVASVQQRLAQISSTSGIQSNPRVQIWAATPGIIADHFVLGVGEGNFAVYTARASIYEIGVDAPFDHAHDLFLTVAAELGLVGLALLLGFVGDLGRATWLALRNARRSRTLILGIAASFVGMMFQLLSDYPLRTPEVLAAVLVVTGVVVGLEQVVLGEANGGGDRLPPG